MKPVNYYVCPTCKSWSGETMEPTGNFYGNYSEYHLNEECKCSKCGWVGTFADMGKEGGYIKIDE